MKCSFCHHTLPPGLVLFCRKDFFDLPAKERSGLVSLHARKQDTTSKVARCVRLLAEKRMPANATQS